MSPYGTYYEINKTNILLRTSPLEIFIFYVPGFKPNTTIISPLGEKHPSFWSKVHANGKIYFQDFSRKNFRGDCFDLVQQLFGLTFPETLEKINRDMNLGLGQNIDVESEQWHLELMNRPKLQAKASTEIHLQYQTRSWTDLDSWFWLRSGCDLRLVKKAGIMSASQLYSAGRYIPTYSLAYVWHTHGPHVKFYQPFAKRKYKWRSSMNNDWLQNEHNLPDKGNQLILQSSLKDALCVESLTGIPGIPPSSENSKFPEEKLNDFEKRFSTIYVLYDSDDTGVKNMSQLIEERNYKPIWLPDVNNEQVKDPSAFCYYGYKKSLIKTLYNHGLKLEPRSG